jgi:GntR family transcriptional regulator
MKIDHESRMPLHAQVEALLRAMVKEEKYRNGELLPPEARIAEKLAVCRNTVRAAISRLVLEGVLERKAGRGTRVVRQSVKTSLENWPSFTREMAAKGIEVEVFSRKLELVRPKLAVARLLQLTAAERRRKLVRLERVRGYGGIPSVSSVSWLHPRTGLSVDDDFAEPLYDLIRERCGIVPEYSEEEVSAALADGELAARLGCDEGDPILVRNRVVSDASRRVIEYNENHYRADRFTYGLTIRKSGS